MLNVITICEDIPEVKIYTPKARRLNQQKNRYKRHDSSNINNDFKGKTLKSSTNSEKSFNLDKISLEEINRDFSMWNESLDEEKCYDEISNILSSSTKDCSFSSQNKETKKIIRPNCPTNKNVEFFDEINLFNLMNKSEI